jgi:hypothetical protein
MADEDMHQPGVITARGEDLLDPCLFAKGLELADELDLQSRSTAGLRQRATFEGKCVVRGQYAAAHKNR